MDTSKVPEDVNEVRRVNQEQEVAATAKIVEDKGKRHATEVCESIESDDSDYIGNIDEESEDDESDVPSEALEDIEGSSDDDIFSSKPSEKTKLNRKLKRMMKEATRPVCMSDRSNVDGWCSDLDNDEDIETLKGPDDDYARHPQFADGRDMKSFEMQECLEFADVDVYRKVLKDWSVRKGYELKHTKNEKTRVTSVCDSDGCNYRIHASEVQGGPIFMVKTIKGEHTCTRSRENKHATARYLGLRVENVVNDT